MAFSALGWLQSKIGIDITGESEFQENLSTKLRKKEDDPISDETLPTLTLPPEDVCRRKSGVDRRARRRHERDEDAEKGLRLSTSRLYFPLPLDKYIMNTVTATNGTGGFVQFKVKATAPARYAVRPRQGVLGPDEKMAINITLRPTKDNPKEMRDKFLIQYRPMTGAEVAFYQASGDLQAVWAGKRDLRGVKIRCKFTNQLPPNFVVNSMVEHESDDEDRLAPVWDEDEEGDLLPDRARSEVIQRHRSNLVSQRRHSHAVPQDD